MLAGSFGLFFTMFLLFCRYLPMVAMAEVKQVLPHGRHETMSEVLRGTREHDDGGRKDFTQRR